MCADKRQIDLFDITKRPGRAEGADTAAVDLQLWHLGALLGLNGLTKRVGESASG